MTKNRALKIVAAGEDFAAVLRAQELSKRLTAELAPELEITSEIWKFETLGSRQVAKEAAHQAAEADLVIIAASGETEPPAQIKHWIEGWMPRKRKGVTALVALLDHEDDILHAASPLCTYLRRLAGKWDMDFFSNTAEWRQRYLRPVPAASARESHRPRMFVPPGAHSVMPGLYPG